MGRRNGRINVDWLTHDSPNFTWEQVAVEVLMDVRDELRRLNRVMYCPNVQQMALAMIRLEKRAAVKGWPLVRKPRKPKAEPPK